MQKEYRTVAAEAFAEFEEKKSKFIATVKPVASEEEAAAFISGLKSRYWNASHNVYAYYICGDNILQKFSDDGEPSGTAGLPVLEAVRKLAVQDVAVVVTRYFGGTLLGAAGLVRAYGRSATLGIEAAGIIKKQLCIKADNNPGIYASGENTEFAGGEGLYDKRNGVRSGRSDNLLYSGG